MKSDATERLVTAIVLSIVALPMGNVKFVLPSLTQPFTCRASAPFEWDDPVCAGACSKS